MPGPSRKTAIMSILFAVVIGGLMVIFLPLVDSFWQTDHIEPKRHQVEKVVLPKPKPRKIYKDEVKQVSKKSRTKPRYQPKQKIVKPKVDLQAKLNFKAMNIISDTSLNFAIKSDLVAASFGGEGLDNLVFNLNQVDQRPIALNKPSPNYPFYARRRRIEGFVTAELIINESGRTEAVKIIKAKPKNVFDKVALNSIKKWLFKPAQKDGKAVAVKRQVTINFELDN